MELADGSTVTTATKMFVDAGLSPRLTGSEAITMLAPLNDAFKGMLVKCSAGQRVLLLFILGILSHNHIEFGHR